jgi:hypothetical protein
VILRGPAGIVKMELRPNLKDGCYGSANGALSACENPALSPVAAAHDVATSKHVDSFTSTDLICDISHKQSLKSAFMSGPASSLAEAASFQPVGKLMSRRRRPHAEPIHTSSVSGFSSAQAGRGLQDGSSPTAALLLKLSGD